MFNIDQFGAFLKSAYKLKNYAKLAKLANYLQNSTCKLAIYHLTFVDKIFQFNF